LRRIEQSHTELLTTFSVIVEQGAFNILNTTSISPLLKALQSPPAGPHREPTVNAACRFMRLTSKECAPMLEPHTPALLVCIGQQKNAALVEVSLQALAAVAKYDDKAVQKDKWVEAALKCRGMN
jgi:sister-chromatid-cohesion protein PDS5